MKRKAHKLRKAGSHPPNRGIGQNTWRRCADVGCPLYHPNDASVLNPGPPGIVRPVMSGTRPRRRCL